jgi:hypothetical protein
MDQIEVAFPGQLPKAAPGRHGVQRCDRSGPPANRLVLAQTTTVAQHFEVFRGVAERQRLDTLFLPAIFDSGSVRRQHGNGVAACDQPTSQIPDEGTGSVTFESRIGLGEE